jgi:hypothetical protein
MVRSVCFGLVAMLTIMVVTLSLPARLPATTFPKFDKMDIEDQAEFVAVMLDATQKALSDDGQADLAGQIEHLFTTIEPGDSMSIGLVEVERNIARARVFDAQHVEKDPQAKRLDVEDALFVTLQKNGIILSTKAMNAAMDALANFHPETYAEFEAKSPAERRRFIGLLVKFAWHDYEFRDLVKSKEAHKESVFFGPNVKGDMLEVLTTNFPSQSSEQPGFAEVAKQIDIGNAKSPNKPGPFYELMMFMLTQADDLTLKRIKHMDENTVILPDGRSVFIDKNGDLWAVSKDSPDTKLEGADKALAQRLSDCKARRGISDGREALAACREEVGISDAGASSTPAPPPEPAKPEAPPAADSASTAPADDPIGSGGFISAPTTFSVLLCVQQDLVDKQSWNQPDAGSKMDYFKGAIGQYVDSIAKPSWEYWIAEEQFAKYDPAATPDPAKLVSPVSPDSGRFDEFDPRCPSGYSGYNLQVKH